MFLYLSCFFENSVHSSKYRYAWAMIAVITAVCRFKYTLARAIYLLCMSGFMLQTIKSYVKLPPESRLFI